ncbi:MAG: hypothetical protein AAGA48_10770 [Myxococcota bacterium]
MLWMIATAAWAAYPTPDRPYVTRSGALVAANTLELELGYRYLNVSQVPAALKYTVKGGVVEARVEANLSGVGQNAPDLLAGMKVKLLRQERNSLALWAASAVPVGEGEAWRGELHLLFTTVLSSAVGLRVESGIDFVGGDGINFGGVPLNAAVTYHPVRRFGLIGEVSGVIGSPGCDDRCIYGNAQVMAGIRGRLTELLVVDASGGYAFTPDEPFVGVGFTSNFGRVE